MHDVGSQIRKKAKERDREIERERESDSERERRHYSRILEHMSKEPCRWDLKFKRKQRRGVRVYACVCDSERNRNSYSKILERMSKEPCRPSGWRNRSLRDTLARLFLHLSRLGKSSLFNKHRKKQKEVRDTIMSLSLVHAW